MKWLQSRQMWTLIFMFVFNGWSAISASVDPQIALVINGLLGILAMYFRIDAQVK